MKSFQAKTLVFLAGLLALAAGCSRKANPLFSNLDYQMSMSPTYDARKVLNIESLKQLAPGRDGNGDFNILLKIGEEYSSYQFDSSLTYFQRALYCAQNSGRKEDIDLANIRLGSLYTLAGHFLEAHRTLFERMDSTTVSPSLKGEYYSAIFKYLQDMLGNSGISDMGNLPDIETIRRSLYANIDPESMKYKEIKVDEYLSRGELERADSINRATMSRMQDSSHDYAIFAWIESLICERLGRSEERMQWLVRSAEADMINSVKDYASLTVIAQSLMDTDIETSFRYLNRSFNDATFYNAKLRPWQICQSLTQIQEAYSRQEASVRRNREKSSIILAVLTAALLVLVYFLVRRSNKLKAATTELHRKNEEISLKNESLSELNRQISEANSLKEEYIGLFLGILSDDIYKRRSFRNTVRNMVKQGKTEEVLRMVSDETTDEEVMRTFYNTFDTTFLALFPTFVEDFNALLSEGSKIYPKKNELLNTELRIYALVRLGIDDSNKIASLLHYSVSTIYNYKVKVKKGALSDKENFEEKVRTIGKIQ